MTRLLSTITLVLCAAVCAKAAMQAAAPLGPAYEVEVDNEKPWFRIRETKTQGTTQYLFKFVQIDEVDENGVFVSGSTVDLMDINNNDNPTIFSGNTDVWENGQVEAENGDFKTVRLLTMAKANPVLSNPLFGPKHFIEFKYMINQNDDFRIKYGSLESPNLHQNTLKTQFHVKGWFQEDNNGWMRRKNKMRIRMTITAESPTSMLLRARTAPVNGFYTDYSVLNSEFTARQLNPSHPVDRLLNLRRLDVSSQLQDVLQYIDITPDVNAPLNSHKESTTMELSGTAVLDNYVGAGVTYKLSNGLDWEFTNSSFTSEISVDIVIPYFQNECVFDPTTGNSENFPMKNDRNGVTYGILFAALVTIGCIAFWYFVHRPIVKKRLYETNNSYLMSRGMDPIIDPEDDEESGGEYPEEEEDPIFD